MKKTSKTIVFFGSGPIAAKSLPLLLRHTAVEAVITKSRPNHYKGDKLVIEIAEEHNLPIHTPKGKQSLTDVIRATSFSSQLGLVIDYGIIIDQEVIDYFPLGILNSHFSLLPQWRGPDPIGSAILSGQDETGVSLMKIDEKMDEGPLLAQAKYKLDSATTKPELAEALVELSDAMLEVIIPLYQHSEIEALPQSTASFADSLVPSYSKMIDKHDGVINWHKPAERIEREIRAYIDWPKSRTTLAEKDVIITKAHAVPTNRPTATPGDVKVVEGMILVECGKGTLCIERLKPAGKKEMSAQAFLAGHTLT